MSDSLLSLAVLPVVLLLWFIYKKDPHPEPRKVLSKVFLFGCLTAIPVIICEIIADLILESVDTSTYGNLFLSVFFGVGLIEEFFKWGVVKLLCFKNKEFDETYDAIVYAAFSSLGFACVENILYVVEGGFGVGIGRALLSVPGHACFGIAMGYFFGLAKKAQAEGRSSSGMQFMALLVPSLLHTAYDFFLEMDTELGLEILVWFAFVIITFVISLICVFSSSKNSVYFGAGVGAAGAGAVQPIANNNAVFNSNVQTVVRPIVAQQGQIGQSTQPIQTNQTPQNAPLVQPVQPVQSQPVQPVVQPAVQPIMQPVQTAQPAMIQSAQPVQPVQSVQDVQSARIVTPQPVQPVLTQSVQQAQAVQEVQSIQSVLQTQQQQVVQPVRQPVQQEAQAEAPQQPNNNQI